MGKGLRKVDERLYSQGLKMCYSCETIKPLDDFPLAPKRTATGRFPTCYVCKKRDGRDRYLKLKTEILALYSRTQEPSCVCCGETILAFLGIDHIHGGGRKHRAEVGMGVAYYRWLKQNHRPDDYQTLCHNCNHGKWISGKCPHEENR
jgi:hypothetical protein